MKYALESSNNRRMAEVMARELRTANGRHTGKRKANAVKIIRETVMAFFNNKGDSSRVRKRKQQNHPLSTTPYKKVRNSLSSIM